MNQEVAKFTVHASEAMEMADLLNLKFAAERYGTTKARFVKVREPDGPSTDGGRKARQSVLLSTGKEDDPDILCGFIDVVKRTAELRTYPVVKSAWDGRFQQELDLSRGEYQRFLDQMLEYLRIQEFVPHLVHSPRSTSAVAAAQPAPSRPSAPSSPWAAIALAAVFGFALCYIMMHFGLIS